MQPLNPYVVGNSVGGSPAFVGREDILQNVHSILNNPRQNAILLHGQRRIGKTSILGELQTQLQKEQICYPIVFDLLGKAHWPVEQVIQELANKISEVLNKAKPQLGDDPKTYFQQTWLPEVLTTIDKPLILLFDEFDALDDDLIKHTKTETEFFSYLYNLMKVSEIKLNFIFVIGCNIGDLTQIASALLKGIPTKRVSLLDQADTFRLITLAEANQTLHWSEKAKKAVWQLTQGHPYLTQQIGYCVWEQLHQTSEKSPPEVLPKHIEQAMPMILERSEGAIHWLWGGLEAAQKVFISAVAEASNKNNKFTTKKQLDTLLSTIGIKISVPALTFAPQFLKNEWDLIIENKSGCYSFKVNLLRRLFAHYKPLHSVKHELNRLEPEANKYYQQAEQFVKDKKLEQALDFLERVLRLNPNHIEAYQLQANVLLDLGKLDEAINKLKKFYHDHPDEARPLLVQTLWNMAQSAKRESEQLKIYEEILEYDKDQVDTKKKIQMIWKQRAERYLRDEDCKSAITAYQQADLKDKAREIRLKCVLDKYSKIAIEIFLFLVILAVSYIADYFLLKQGISSRWWLWGPILGLGVVFLAEKFFSKQPPEKF